MSGNRKPALDLRHPFFLPMWRRVVVVVLLVAWLGVELVFGNPYWAVLAGGIAAYAAYVFFFAFDLPEDP